MPKSFQVVSEVVSLTFKIYRLLGWNPIDDVPGFKAKFYFVVSMIYAGMCLLQEIIYFVINFGGENSFLILTNVAPCMGFTTLGIVKTLSVYVNRKPLKRIYEQLSNYYMEGDNQYGVEGTIRTSRDMLKILSATYMILIWVFNLMPIFIFIFYLLYDGSIHKEMPYFMWYPWDTEQPIAYELSYLVVMWGAFTSAIGILTTDLLFCTILTFTCMQFDVLGYQIKEIVAGKMPSKKLRKWVDDHNELNHICNEIEEIFSLSILVNFVGSTVIICMNGFQTYQGDKTSEFIKFCLFLVASLIQIFIICWHGQQIDGLSEAISDEAYGSDWTQADESLKKDLLLVIFKSQKPKFLTAMKFAKVSMQSFMTILSTSFSYFAFMRTVYDTTSTK